MLWTAPDTWGIICSTIGKITCEKCPKSRMGEQVKKKINPNHQMLFTAPDTWGIISSTIGKITCEKCPKSRMGEQVKKKITPTIRCCGQHLMVGA